MVPDLAASCSGFVLWRTKGRLGRVLPVIVLLAIGSAVLMAAPVPLRQRPVAHLLRHRHPGAGPAHRGRTRRPAAVAGWPEAKPDAAGARDRRSGRPRRVPLVRDPRRRHRRVAVPGWRDPRGGGGRVPHRRGSATDEPGAPTWFSLRPLCAIGLISYGIYLFHWPIYIMLTPDRIGLHGYALFAVRLAVTLIIATRVVLPHRDAGPTWIRSRGNRPDPPPGGRGRRVPGDRGLDDRPHRAEPGVDQRACRRHERQRVQELLRDGPLRERRGSWPSRPRHHAVLVAGDSVAFTMAANLPGVFDGDGVRGEDRIDPRVRHRARETGSSGAVRSRRSRSAVAGHRSTAAC